MKFRRTLPPLVALYLLLLMPQLASAGCQSQFGITTFPPAAPHPGKFACAKTQNEPRGNILVSQEYIFDGITLRAYFKDYKNRLEGSGWKIAGVRNVPLLHALFARHPSGLTLEFSARESTSSDQMFDPKTFDPKTAKGFPSLDENKKEFSGKIIIKKR